MSAQDVHAMQQAVLRFLGSLDTEQKAAAMAAFGSPERTTWSYLPGPRPGLALVAMTSRQQELALALLDTSCGMVGTRTARGVIELCNPPPTVADLVGLLNLSAAGSGQYEAWATAPIDEPLGRYRPGAPRSKRQPERAAKLLMRGVQELGAVHLGEALTPSAAAVDAVDHQTE